MIFRMRNVKRVRSKGRLYFYHWPTRTRLPGAPGSPEFLAAWQSCESKLAARAPRIGTLRALLAEYRASPEFRSCADRTKADRHELMNYLAELGVDDVMLATITTPDIMRLRDKISSRRTWHFANKVRSLLSAAFNWGLPRGHVASNPVRDVKPIPKPRHLPRKNRPWSTDELGAVLAAASAPMRAAVSLAAFTALREGDVVRLTWSSYDGGTIETVQAKTGKLVRVPAHSRLRSILSETPKRAVQIVTGERGCPLTLDGFKTNFFKLIRRLEREGKVARGLTFHGLRHTAATALAECGCSPHEIQAVTGHRTLAMVQRYTEAANRARNAETAIAKLERTNTGRGEGKP